MRKSPKLVGEITEPGQFKQVIGIDNGISGGLACISVCGDVGHVVWMHTMPSTVNQKVNAKGKARSFGEIDAQALRNLLLEHASPLNTLIAMEDCPEHASRASTMRSMAFNAGIVYSTCNLMGFSVVRVMPHTWQNEMLGTKIPKGQTKACALSKSQEYWPTESWLPTERSKVPHDGLVDAALIAKYTIDKYLAPLNDSSSL